MKSYNGFTPYQRTKGDKILKAAIGSGLIPDPNTQPCQICGQTQGIRHYHNEDYTPENIVNDARVLCWRCHMMLHSRFSHPESFAKYMIETTIYKRIYPAVYHHDYKILEQHFID